jgi:2-polyprenyl-3-methyl-5-hydroxy-6-metoxy-1,4-benzoquinol methylase
VKQITVKDFSVTGEEFQLAYDSGLELLKTTPQPTAEEIGRYYESDDYISHTDGKRGLFEKVYQVVKARALKNKLKIVSSYVKPSGTLLDFGCGTGDFLVEAKKSGWATIGFEPNASARSRAESKGLSLIDDISNIPENSVDVITLWHVLEHVHDVDYHLNLFSRLLKPDGILVIAVPNFRSYDAEVYGAFWAAYDVPRHLWHFSRNAISKLAALADMRVINEHPMMFDSYYVSLLSERYKTGKMNPIRAFWNGFRSNQKASKTGEYSSVIYILKNK